MAGSFLPKREGPGPSEPLWQVPEAQFKQPHLTPPGASDHLEQKLKGTVVFPAVPLNQLRMFQTHPPRHPGQRPTRGSGADPAPVSNKLSLDGSHAQTALSRCTLSKFQRIQGSEVHVLYDLQLPPMIQAVAANEPKFKNTL